jgi:hypothetical protein
MKAQQPTQAPRGPCERLKLKTKPKLRHGKVSGHRRLLPFASEHPHPHVRRLDHPNVVAPIANRQAAAALVC